MKDDVVVIGFPCNQFGLQEPGQNSELLNAVKYVRPGGGYVPKFAMSEKLDVNGDSSHELFKRMRNDCPGTTNVIGSPSSMYWSPVAKNDITWNFEKFLVDRQGMVYKRYNPAYPPQNMVTDVRDVVAKIDTPISKIQENGQKYIKKIFHQMNLAKPQE